MEWKTPLCFFPLIGALATKTLALFVRLESARYLLPVKEKTKLRLYHLGMLVRMHAWASVSSRECGFLCENALLPFAYLKGTPARAFRTISDKGREDFLPHTWMFSSEMRQQWRVLFSVPI